jgi:3-deoxy-D-manno-octulosonic acid kinase
MNDAMGAAAVHCDARSGLIHDPRFDAATAAAVFAAAGEERGGRGRGAIRIVAAAGLRLVVRHYRRGGLVARVNDDWFPWLGAEATRPFREFRITANLFARGLPVPRPFAARYRRGNFGYRADLATQEVANARTLAERLADPESRVGIDWGCLGSTLAAFHRAGLWHADLNAHNVLFDAAGAPLLIDFDRARFLATGASALAGNLDRLARSLRKLGHADVVAGSAWTELQRAYAAGR